VLIGEQPVWNPLEWAAVIAANRSLREQLRRARVKGVRVREVALPELAPTAPMRVALESLADRWLAARPMTSLHFLVELEPFEQLEHRRVFVAERANADGVSEVVAFASLAPVAARNGWLFEHILRDQQAPNGTSETLVDVAMRALAADGSTWATLGLAPLAGSVSGWLRFARDAARPFYNFAGLSAFKRKLRPQHWEPIYLAYAKERHSIWAMRDGLRAFAGGSLIMFGVRTVLRGPPPLLHALELSLYPWTLALALWPATPWFPLPFVKWSWVAFDIALLAALYRLRQRWTRPLAVVIAAIVTMDTVLTALQAALWNVSRTRSPFEGLMVVVACAGPALAAAVLWGAVRRQDRMGR
jgi:phosphatidylglycerol lysyltransferase